MLEPFLIYKSLVNTLPVVTVLTIKSGFLIIQMFSITMASLTSIIIGKTWKQQIRIESLWFANRWKTSKAKTDNEYLFTVMQAKEEQELFAPHIYFTLLLLLQLIRLSSFSRSRGRVRGRLRGKGIRIVSASSAGFLVIVEQRSTQTLKC